MGRWDVIPCGFCVRVIPEKMIRKKCNSGVRKRKFVQDIRAL